MFKVYNGPVPLPQCKAVWYGQAFIDNQITPWSQQCRENICCKISDQYCRGHALEYVKLWDKMNATEQERL